MALQPGALTPEPSEDRNGIVIDPFSEIAWLSTLTPGSGEPVKNAPVKALPLPVIGGTTISAADFKRFLLAAQYAFDGIMVDRYRMQELTGAPQQTVDALINNKHFQEACEHRGHPTFEKAGLSTQQLLAIPALTDSTTPSLAARLKKAGITDKTYQQWKKQPAFAKMLDRNLKDLEPEMLTALSGQAVNGDLRAIELAFEITGKHNPRQQQQVDLQVIVGKVLEAITQEVKDTDTLARINARLGLLMQTTPVTPMQLIEVEASTPNERTISNG